MARVTFEFDDIEDRADVEAVIGRYKLLSAIDSISELLSIIYNGKIYDHNVEIYVLPEGRVATEEDYKKANEEGKFLSGGKTYLDSTWVENRLDLILENVRHLLSY